MTNEQKALDEWMKEKGWKYWTPHESLARVTEEVGELARLINHAYGPKKKKDSESKQELEDEIGDILYGLACIATPHGIDLNEAFAKSLEKVKKRDKDRF